MPRIVLRIVVGKLCSMISNRDTDGSVNIIFNFGWAGSAGSANFVSDRAKGTRHGNFFQRHAFLTEIPMSGAFSSVGSPNYPSIDRKRSKAKLYLQNPYSRSGSLLHS